MKAGETTGLDTNVLVLADDAASPHNARAKAILEQVLKGSLRACISQQVLAEYFSVVTSPRRLARPLKVNEAMERVRFLSKSRKIRKIYPKRSTLLRCVEYCAGKGITGPRIFDAQYAFTLMDNGIKRLITQNVRDFSAFEGLKAENPFA